MLSPLDILVVDDEHWIRITLAEILEDEGYNVVVAENVYNDIMAAGKTKLNLDTHLHDH